MEFLERIKTIVEEWDKAKVKQTWWVYCPACGNELTAADDESLYHYEMGLVVYGCAECGTVSKWDFDAPAPILISFVESNSGNARRAAEQGELRGGE